MSRILIVEDDRKIAQLESDYLESNGYETKIIEDGKKALSELKTNHYDLITSTPSVRAVTIRIGMSISSLIFLQISYPLHPGSIRSRSIRS